MAIKPPGMDRNARKRLSRLTGEKSPYHDKYRRLSASDKRLIDDLVRRNDGREARVQINDLDAARRAVVRHRSKVRRRVDKYLALPDAERTQEAGFALADDDSKFWDDYHNRRAA